MGATNAVHVDSTNAEQLQAWDGSEGAYWAAHAERFDRSIRPYDERLFAAAAIHVHDRVLDIGCGTGQTTRDAARAANTGTAFGIDLSSRMLDYARRRAADEGVHNVSFEQADAQIYPFDRGAFDVAISRTGAMFFGDPDAAFTNIGAALRPGGRLVLIAWQSLSQNEWIREIMGALAAGRTMPEPPPDARGPFALANADRVADVLGRAGFVNVDLEGTSADMWFGDNADDAYEFVIGLMGWMVQDVDDATRARALDALRATMVAHATAAGVVFGSSAWTISATRR